MIRQIKNIAHKYEARVANLYYGRPSRKIATIGVTGTDGKTTTSSLIFHILSKAGYKVAMITTVGAQIIDKKYETGLHTTTPSSFTLQKYIKMAVDAGCEYLVLEVTSHALDQNRIHGVFLKIGVVTNITHEHLDYHGSYDNYLLSKARLFGLSALAILNADDSSFDKLQKAVKIQKISYSLNKPTDYNLKNIDIELPRQFDFNLQNYMAAVAVAKRLEVDDSIIKSAIYSFKFPEGRQEIVYDKEFRAIIDFAHTPNSFQQILPALKKTAKKRLIHVFSAAGLRDASKRPLMGEISSQYADVIILTAEDPRSEPITDINNQIKLGVKNFRYVSKDLAIDKNDKKICIEIDDRREAIDFAIRIANVGDTIITTGKGHEKSINLGNGEEPWSERETVARAIKNKNAS